MGTILYSTSRNDPSAEIFSVSNFRGEDTVTWRVRATTELDRQRLKDSETVQATTELDRQHRKIPLPTDAH